MTHSDARRIRRTRCSSVTTASLDREGPGQSATRAVHWKGEIDERWNDARASCMLVFSFFNDPRREASKNAPAMQNLPPIWLSGYPAIIFGKNFKQKREKRNAMREKKISKKNFPAIQVPEHNPSLTYLCRGFRQNFLSEHKLDTYIWIHSQTHAHTTTHHTR